MLRYILLWPAQQKVCLFFFLWSNKYSLYRKIKGRNLNWFDNTKGTSSRQCQYGNPLAQGCSGNMNAPKWKHSAQVWDNLMQHSPLSFILCLGGPCVFKTSRFYILHFKLVWCEGLCKSSLPVSSCSEERAPSTGVSREWEVGMRTKQNRGKELREGKLETIRRWKEEWETVM